MARTIITIISTMLLLAGCNIPQTIETPESTQQSSDWIQIDNGLEWRNYIPNDNPILEIIVLRIDPEFYTFRPHYRQETPLYASGWHDELPNAVAFINANFFTPEQALLGILITDNIVYGTPYTDRGGLFFVQNETPSIRSNITHPYYTGEPIEQAVQAHPMLINNGQPVDINYPASTPTRRSAIGQDTKGRIILIATPQLGLSLPDLAQYLATTDMQLMNAFNLDGGGSTMMYFDEQYHVASFDPVPAILAVYKKR